MYVSLKITLLMPESLRITKDDVMPRIQKCISSHIASHCLLQALKEKELGNAAYKMKEFTVALQHYDKALKLDPDNITFMTNKAGGYYLVIVCTCIYAS